MNERMNNEHGLTLVELLAVFVTISIFSVVAYAVLTNGIKAYDRIEIDSKLRDEADIVMAELIIDLYMLKNSEIEQQNFPEEGTNNHYFKLRDDRIVGFYEGKIYLTNGETIALKNDNITLHEDSEIILKDNRHGLYKVLLTLQYENGDKLHQITTESEVSILKDF